MTQIAAGVHREAIIIDGLNASYAQDDGVLDRWLQGGLTAVNSTVAAWHGPDETLREIGRLLRVIQRRSAQVMQVRSVGDIHSAKAAGKVGVIFGFQDSAPLAGQLDALDAYHALGVRIIQLTYNDSNLVGSGCLAREDSGLTEFGRAVVTRMNALGMLVDLSHCGERTTREAIDVSSAPVAFTHANAHEVFGHPRNKKRDAIQALVARGGVIGAVSAGFLLNAQARASLDDVVRMIDVLVEMAGIDHVGIGTDFMEALPEDTLNFVFKSVGSGGPGAEQMRKLFQASQTTGFESPALFGRLTQALARRGYREGDLRKIMGLNWLRLYNEVWL